MKTKTRKCKPHTPSYVVFKTVMAKEYFKTPAHQYLSSEWGV